MPLFIWGRVRSRSLDITQVQDYNAIIHAYSIESDDED